MTPPQQSEQAEAPVVGEVMPGWLALRIDRLRVHNSADPYDDNTYQRACLWLADALTASQARAAKRGECLAFFASVIKSGEPWTATCQREYDAAMERDK